MGEEPSNQPVLDGDLNVGLYAYRQLTWLQSFSYVNVSLLCDENDALREEGLKTQVHRLVNLLHKD